MNDPAIRALDVVKEYDGGAVRALDGISLEVAQGEFVSVMGPSGSGKSTLLHLIGALDVPTSGEIHLNGRTLSGVRDLDRVRLLEVGFMVPTGLARTERRRRSRELLERVELGRRLDAPVTRLSGGERQRVSIARALANRPSVILADEPTGDVDSKTGEGIMRLIQSVRREVGATLVLVTHNPEITRDADRVFEMRDGRLQEITTRE
jgi:ABC-type lipoprotein export system ATPase subunit